MEAREASLETKATLRMEYPVPTAVATLEGFNELDEEGLKKFIDEKGLAMDLAISSSARSTSALSTATHHHRDQDDRHLLVRSLPHTTFGTILDDVQIDDAVVQEAFDRYMAMRTELGRENKPRCMMDLPPLVPRS